MSERYLAWRKERLSRRIPELDGVRGLAILSVLIWHVASSVQATPGSWLALSIAAFRLTWSGVDLFFVLSGFLIGGILLDARESPEYYRVFYLRRVHRIFPVYFVWIGLFALGLVVTGSRGEGPIGIVFNHNLPAWSYPLFIQNFFMASRRTFGPEWLAITWSLAIEEQFYFLLPWLVRNLTRERLAWAVVASVAAAPAIRTAFRLAGNLYVAPWVLLPCRADALGMGVLLAMACRNERMWTWLDSHRRYMVAALWGLGCGLVYFLKFNQLDARLYTVGLSWIACFYAVLVALIVIAPGPAMAALFRAPLLAILGTVSYAVYIFHQGIIRLFHWWLLGREPLIDGAYPALVTALALLAAFVLAAVSWRAMERPLIARAHARYRYR